MANPRFVVTDGTTTIDFLATQGFLLRSWNPVANQIRAGGVRNESGLADGSVPAMARRDNSVEDISFVARHVYEDSVYIAIQNLLRLLEKAVDYWTSSWSATPVWIEARGPNETNTRYGTIVMYSFLGITGPFEQPLYSCLSDPATPVTLQLEHLPWQNAAPGNDVCVQTSSLITTPWMSYSVFYPEEQDDDSWVDTSAATIDLNDAYTKFGGVDGAAAYSAVFTPTQSGDDAYIQDGPASISLAQDYLTFGRDSGGDAIHAGIRFRNVTIPAGAVITSAHLRFQAYATNYGGPLNVLIKGENDAAPAVFSTYADFAGRVRGAVTAAWSGVSSWTSGSRYNSPDISAVVQEIVTTHGAVTEMVFFVEENGSAVSAYRRPYAWDSSTGTEPRLVVTWTAVLAATSYHTGIRFRSLTIPAASTITSARLRFEAQSSNDFDSVDAAVKAEDAAAPAVFSTYANFMGRARTAASVGWSGVEHWTSGLFYESPDIKDVIQEINTSHGAVTELTIFVEDSGSDSAERRPMSWDGAGAEPELHVWWDDGVTITRGQEATCEDEVFVANKCNRAAAEMLFVYEDAGGTYTTPAALPFTILPSTAGFVDDLSAAYFGALTGPFCSLAFDIDDIAVYTGAAACDWEYWDGAAWAALNVNDDTVAIGDTIYYTNGKPFGRAGVNSVVWNHPADWTVNIVNGQAAWWVRCVATLGGGTITEPTQQNRSIYTVLLARVTIDDLQVPGDIPLRGRIRIAARNHFSDYYGTSSRLIIGVRSLARTTSPTASRYFAAYINLADEQNPDGVAVTAGALGVMTGTSGAITHAPTARWIHATVPAVTEGIAADIYFDSAEYAPKNYRGSFHAFLRYIPTPLAVSASWPLRARLNWRFAQWRSIWTPLYNAGTDVAPGPEDRMYVADLGRIQLQLLSPLKDDIYNLVDTSLYVELDNQTGNPAEVDLIDLVLIPADEWLADVRVPSFDSIGAYGHLFIDRYLDVDSATMPYYHVSATVRDGERATPGTYGGAWITHASEPVMFQANSDQELWFLAMQQVNATQRDNLWQSYPYPTFSIRASGVARYLVARGSR